MIDAFRIFAAVVLIVGAGRLHGDWTNRWGSSKALVDLSARVESVPMVIGQWKGTDRELPAAERAIAGATACLARQYTNATRGVTVDVFLMAGLPGKIGVHTPQICYTGAGRKVSEATPYAYSYGSGRDQRTAEFLTATATREGTDPSVLRIFWSWNPAKGWTAPAEARWAFASEPVLCKLYVVRETGAKAEIPDRDPCNEFLKVFLPELDRVVFSVSG
jgi:hypothetical protein